MRRTAIILASFVMLLTLGATAQESRSEISVQGTGFFTRDSNGQGISRTATDTGGFLVGYRYHFNRWLSGEASYGYDRDTQKYFSAGGLSRVQSDVHTATAAAVVNLPFRISRLNPYILGGGGSLVFHPTGNAGGFVSGADTQAKGAFLYGVGVNYGLLDICLCGLNTGAMSTRIPTLASGHSTLIAGRTRRNHPLELFSDSDRGALGRQSVPACHIALIVVENLGSRPRTARRDCACSESIVELQGGLCLSALTLVIGSCIAGSMVTALRAVGPGSATVSA